MKTTVIYRRYKSGDKSVVALFPEIEGDCSGNCLAYEHIGQHGAANYNHMVAITTPADAQEDDVIELHNELIGIGYELRIAKRRNRTGRPRAGRLTLR